MKEVVTRQEAEKRGVAMQASVVSVVWRRTLSVL